MLETQACADEYLVQWNDCEDLTWESAQNLNNVSDMVEEFNIKKKVADEKRASSMKVKTVEKLAKSKDIKKGSLMRGDKIKEV